MFLLISVLHPSENPYFALAVSVFSLLHFPAWAFCPFPILLILFSIFPSAPVYEAALNPVKPARRMAGSSKTAVNSKATQRMGTGKEIISSGLQERCLQIETCSWGQKQFSRVHHETPHTWVTSEKEEQGETPPFPSAGEHWIFALFLITREGGKVTMETEIQLITC